MSRSFGFLIARNPPSRTAGVLTAAVLVALCTLVVYALDGVAPAVSLSVVYLPAVLLVSITWGGWLGLLTGVASAVAFDFFHVPPVGRLSVNDSRIWVALAAFMVVSAVASSIGEIARARTRDAEDRRLEADLAAELARLLLSGNSVAEALPTVAARVRSDARVALGRDRDGGRCRVMRARSPSRCVMAPARSARCWSGRTPRR